MTGQSTPTAGMMVGAGSAPANALVKDTTTATFSADVISESARQPVLVDFWAPWCGPCKQLTPILEKVVQASGGKVKLVKMNIEEHPQIAGRLGIKSIPAVIAFQRGQPIDGFVGALPESQLRSFVERLVGPVGDPMAELITEAEAAVAAGDAQTAADLYGEVLAEDDGHLGAITGLAKLHVEAGQIEEARRLLDAVPPAKETDPAVGAARAALALAEQAASLGDVAALEKAVAADADNHSARFDLAAALNARGHRDEAADHLLEIIRRDRTWDDDRARKQLVQFFDAWGPMDPSTKTGRRKLSSLLFS